MNELLALLASWQMLMLAVVVFGIAPGLALRLIVLLLQNDDPRRRELVAELYTVPRIERPLWVAEQLEVALCEGLRERIVRAMTNSAQRFAGRWPRRTRQHQRSLGLRRLTIPRIRDQRGVERVRIKATCTVLRTGQIPVDVRASAWWLFDPVDPFAVTLSIASRDKPVDWQFSRELLATGLVFPVGDGDVRIEPTLRDVLLIELRSPSGQVLLQLDATEARRVLDLSFAGVPLGAETRATDLDAELAAICDP